jgi:hypothetical protein
MGTKPILLDAILELELKGIEKAFPNGVIRHEGKGKAQDRFSPAEESIKPDKTLKELLKLKRQRQAPKRLLGKTHGYTENPAFALYTTPDAGEAVDEVFQRQICEESRVTFDQSRTTTYRERLLAEKKQLQVQLQVCQEKAREQGVNIRSDVRVIERRLAEIHRKLGVGAAA